MAKPSGASAFFYLGDMERTPPADAYFPRALDRSLDRSILFCPVFGNHEALVSGALPSLHPDEQRQDFVRSFLLVPTCPAPARTLERALADGRVFYSIDLPGDVHFVALDNVSDGGFGDDQLRWLRSDLSSARGRGMTVIAGMHKALAQNPVTRHSMIEDEGRDGRVWRESEAALALFEEQGVDLILASHEHGFWEIRQRTAGEGDPQLHHREGSARRSRPARGPGTPSSTTSSSTSRGSGST